MNTRPWKLRPSAHRISAAIATVGTRSSLMLGPPEGAPLSAGPAIARNAARGPADLAGHAAQERGLAGRGPGAGQQAAQLGQDLPRVVGVQVADGQERAGQVVQGGLDLGGGGPLETRGAAPGPRRPSGSRRRAPARPGPGSGRDGPDRWARARSRGRGPARRCAGRWPPDRRRRPCARPRPARAPPPPAAAASRPRPAAGRRCPPRTSRRPPPRGGWPPRRRRRARPRRRRRARAPPRLRGRQAGPPAAGSSSPMFFRARQAAATLAGREAARGRRPRQPGVMARSSYNSPVTATPRIGP